MNIINPVTAIPGALTAYFPDSCPSGWSEYTDARGRYIVGLPSGGDKEGTVGTALSDKQDRAVGQHNHTFSGTQLGTHGHSFTGTDHTHSFTGASHGHSARVISEAATDSDPEDRYLADAGAGAGNYVRGSGTLVDMGTNAITGATAGGTNADVTQGGSNAAITAGTPAGSIVNSGSVASTNAPYIQLICCVKD